MELRKKGIEQVFRDELHSFSPAPPKRVWDSIENELNDRKKKRAIPLIYSIAASIVLLVGLGSLMFGIFKFSMDPAPIPPASKQVALKTEKSALPSDSNNIERAVASERMPTTKKPQRKRKSFTNSPIVPLLAASSETEMHVVREDPMVLVKKRRIEASLEMDLIDEVQIQPVQPSNEQIIYANNLLAENYNTDAPIGRWELGGQAGPQYSYRDLSVSSTSAFTEEAYNANEKGVVSYAGGIHVTMRASKRLAIQSGVYYSKIGQSKNADFAYYRGGQDYSPNLNANAPGVKLLNSTGNIENLPVHKAQDGVLDYVDPSLPTQEYALASDNVEISQYFEYLEVPLTLRYKVIDKKIGLDLIGGLSTNFLIGNNVFVDDDNVGSTEGISEINYSSTFGIGLNYPLTSKLRLNMEPTFKYYLNSINQNQDVQVRPYTIGIMTGVSYSF